MNFHGIIDSKASRYLLSTARLEGISTLPPNAHRSSILNKPLREPMRWALTRAFASTARMALYEPPDPSKLICMPGTKAPPPPPPQVLLLRDAGSSSSSTDLSPSPSSVAPAGSQAHGQAEQFTRGKLCRSDLDPASPIPQFLAWFSHAQASHLVEHPEACTLSTAALPSGRISSRMVYLKELDAKDPHGGSFVVYSNWATSRKAADIASNPRAALLFWWEALQRQVRVEGVTKRMSREESQAYFDTRARGSRIGAWASRQSQVLHPRTEVDGVDGQGQHADAEVDDGRAQLEGWVGETEKRFEGREDIPVPEFWGGMRIVPDRVEFWQGRESRLHDRFVYDWDEKENKWKIERLSP